jgi:uncharacterized protein with FMN-binding domain
MRKPVLALMTGLTALVVGLGIRAGGSPDSVTVAGAAGAGVVAVAPSTSSGTPSGTSTDTSGGSTSSAGSSSSSDTAPTTVNGDAVGTRYGPVQVQIVVTGGKVVSAEAIVYPTQDRRDQEINSWAIPQLNDEAVQAQDGGIDTVSGATVTSEGYIGSLQSAIDQARSAGVL